MIRRYVHVRIQVDAPDMAEFVARTELLREALSKFHYVASTWTDDPRPANPVLYAEYRRAIDVAGQDGP